MTARKHNSRRRAASWLAAGPVLGTSLAVLIGSQGSAVAATAPPLGTAATYAVLAATTVTNTGDSVLTGNLGLSPGTSVTGFPPGTITGGSKEVANPAAAQAQTDLTAAYDNAAAQTPTTTGLSSIGNQTLTPGVYNAAAALLVNGTLTLDGQGDPDAVFIIQVGSALTAANGTSIVLENGAQACNVFWQVGSSATLGIGSAFQGSILALTSITVTTGDTLTGQALAMNGAVTLDDDAITAQPACALPVPMLASPLTLAGAVGVAGVAWIGWFLVRRRKVMPAPARALA
jgi:Ice-binding-like